MKTMLACMLVMFFIIFCYSAGIITSKYATCEPTPEQCVSAFEKYAC